MSGVVKIVIVILVLAGLGIGYFFAAPSGGGFGGSKIVIGVPNWESAEGTAHVLGAMLEREFEDVSVRFEPRTNEEIYAGIADGSVHVHPEGWFPNHSNWHEQFAEALDRNFHTTIATQRLCVDRSLAEEYDVLRVEDLVDPEKVAFFDSDGNGLGEGWIGVDGWGATPVEQIRAKSYGYDKTFDLMIGEEATALEQFEQATAARKLFLLYCYTPHWMWRAFDLHQLEEPDHDPEKWRVIFPSESSNWFEESDAPVAWEPASLNVYFARSLEGEHPDVAAFLRDVHFTEEELLDIVYGVYNARREGSDLREFAEEWVERNRS